MPTPVFYGLTEDVDIKENFALRTFRFTEDPLSRKERRLLEKNWAKLQALIEGTIVSSGADDQHFVEVFKDKKGQPTTKLELAWLKYHSALQEEKRQKAAWLAQKKKSAEYEEYLKSRF